MVTKRVNKEKKEAKVIKNKVFIALSRNRESIAADRAALISRRTVEHAKELLDKRRRDVEDLEAEIASKYDISALPETTIDNRVKGDNDFAKNFVKDLDKLHIDLYEAEVLYELTEEWVKDLMEEVTEEK